MLEFQHRNKYGALFLKNSRYSDVNNGTNTGGLKEISRKTPLENLTKTLNNHG